MSTAKNSILRVGAATVLVALALLLVVPAIQAATFLAIGGVQVSGSLVVVQLRNSTTVSVAGYVQVQAVVNDANTSSFAAFDLDAGECGSVAVPFAGPVSQVTQVGVTSDSPQPF